LHADGSLMQVARSDG